LNEEEGLVYDGLYVKRGLERRIHVDSTDIGYVIVNERVYKKVVKFKVEKKGNVDHLPVGLRLERKEEEDSEIEGEEEKETEEAR